ncbi:MAG: DNA replication and repair protein RecF [Saprospiraceae bacterium]|nr:DNA replication and repair protein RecF [Saprospiraceae bacterium]
MTSQEVQTLRLIQFKSYQEATFAFGQGFQVIVGRNGMGKTNVLDALHYLGLCRSYFSLRDHELVRHGQNFFRLEATVLHDAKTCTYVAKVQPGDRKEFERDKKVYPTLSEHIGQLPVVLVAPNDTEIISGFSESRRKFMDQTLCQVAPHYLASLSLYNRLLLQRNAYLKSVVQGVRFDAGMLQAIDQQMGPAAEYMGQLRKEFVAELMLLASANYNAISRAAEASGATYQGALVEHDTWSSLMADSLSQDLRMGRTMRGLHRDELHLTLDGFPARRFSSQGQLKSFVFALKLAQFQYASAKTGRPPLLLLDDIFDKLDHERVEALLQFLIDQKIGQIFITDTDADRVPDVLKAMHQAFRTFHVNDSSIHEVTSG